MSQFSTEELNLLLHAMDAYARTMSTREAHVGPACRLKDKLCDLGADYTGPIPGAGSLDLWLCPPMQPKNDPDCPKCGWGVIGCAEERTGCTNRAKKTAKL